MSTIKETPAKKVVKGSKNNKKGAPQFFSDKNVKPFNDVYRYDERTKTNILVPGLTEEEKIKENARYPYVQTPSFKKTEKERAEWKLVHTNAKFPGNWMSADANKHSYFRHTLIVHLKNLKKDPDFRTTYSFDNITEPEIHRVLGLIINLDNNKEDDTYMNYVVKYHFAGKTVLGNGKKS